MYLKYFFKIQKLDKIVVVNLGFHWVFIPLRLHCTEVDQHGLLCRRQKGAQAQVWGFLPTSRLLTSDASFSVLSEFTLLSVAAPPLKGSFIWAGKSGNASAVGKCSSVHYNSVAPYCRGSSPFGQEYEDLQRLLWMDFEMSTSHLDS